MIHLFFNNLDKSLKTDQNKTDNSTNSITKVYSYSTSSIQVKLCHFDLRINQLNQLNSFLWSNYTQLSQIADLQVKLETRLDEYLNDQILGIQIKCFNDDEEAMRVYLEKKKFNYKLLDMAEKLEKQYPDNAKDFRCLINLVVKGCVLACLFCPCDPLDPFEYDILVKKCADDVHEIQEHEKRLEEFNTNQKLRAGVFFESEKKTDSPENEESINEEEFYFQRSNQSEYFFIKNELDSGVQQFCSYERVGRMVEELFRVCVGDGKKKDLIEDEYKIWIRSLEKFCERMMQRFCSFTDVVYLPLNGLALVGYGIKAIYTKLK